MGRPSSYTPEIAATICERLANGESLRAICADDGLPPESTVRLWVVDDVQGFAAHYTRARDVGLETVAEQIIEIADTPCIGVKTKTGDDGKTETTEGDMIEHRRLQVDARKWYLSKIAPKKYGERQHVEHSGSIDLAGEIAAARKRSGA